jgi:DNA-binding NarL/FixJ family response regulator
MKSLKLAIVEADSLFLQGLTTLLSQDKIFQVVVASTSGERFLQLLAYAHADVVLMDLNLPGMNGLKALPRIRKISPQTAVVLWSKAPQAHHIRQSLRLGAKGFIEKNCQLEELSQTLREAANSDTYENELMQKAMYLAEYQRHNPSKKCRISPREVEVLNMLCLEKTNKEIAQALQLSARTVEGHRKSLLTKTGARNLAGLVLFAVKEGLVSY